jgi:MFS transporter, PPP family, 3-phenylpropionic acid transporter
MRVLLDRFGSEAILTAGLWLAVLRWSVCALSADSIPLALAQTLHAATFAAFHIAAVGHTFREFGPSRGATGQAIYSSVTYGLGSILGMVGSGLLRDRIGTQALFALAAATAALGALLMKRTVR